MRLQTTRWIALSLLWPALAAAHDISTSYSRFSVNGSRVTALLTINLGDLHNLPALDANRDEIVTDEEMDEGIVRLFEAIKVHFRAESGGRSPARTSLLRYESVSQTGPVYDLAASNVIRMDIEYVFDSEVRDLRVISTLDQITQPNHRHLLTFGTGDDSAQAVLGADVPFVDIDADGQTFFEVAWQYVRLGIAHIFTGYDHLAFLVGLLLLTSTLLGLVKVVTSFTVAHSITLALATFDAVALPPRLIESLIALSIAYVAIENFTGKTLVHRWKITFLFGLVHGFGFANNLKAMELSRSNLAISLFSFNVGVEAGQLLFVSLVFPLLLLMARTRWREHVTSAASLAIMCLGFYWFVQRAFLT